MNQQKHLLENNMTTNQHTAKDINWLLTNFSEKTPGVKQSIAVSSDGLLMATASNLDRAAADTMAAIVTGLRSLADGAARVLDSGTLSQVIVEMGTAYLFVAAISGGATLGVVCYSDCDLGLVGYEITMLVKRVGIQLTPELIAELKSSLAAV
jgi:uncharacterized protein